MAKYSYCYGIVKDANWMEHTCERRDDCIYYHIDNMRNYWTNPDYQMFVPPVHDGVCPYFKDRGREELRPMKFDSSFD